MSKEEHLKNAKMSRRIPSFYDDKSEKKNCEERPEADDEGDADGVLALDVESGGERRQDRTILRVIDRFLVVGSEPF
jgi:hypothetical protein